MHTSGTPKPKPQRSHGCISPGGCFQTLKMEQAPISNYSRPAGDYCLLLRSFLDVCTKVLVCIYIYMCVCMYVCMYVCTYVHIYIYIQSNSRVAGTDCPSGICSQGAASCQDVCGRLHAEIQQDSTPFWAGAVMSPICTISMMSHAITPVGNGQPIHREHESGSTNHILRPSVHQAWCKECRACLQFHSVQFYALTSTDGLRLMDFCSHLVLKFRVAL